MLTDIPRAWRRDKITRRDWLVPLPPRCVDELDAVAGQLRRDAPAADLPSPGRFALAACAELMAEVRARLRTGIGLAVVDPVPVERYTVEAAGVLTRHQVLVNTALLLFAGHETTMNLICNGTLALVRHPEQWARLKADPAAWAAPATEECLRYDPPVKSTQRIATEDVTLGGKLIRKDDRIRWAIASANRDPAAFPDPDRFDIGRSPNPHVAFGAGIHFCLGVTLARLEGQEVFRALAERFPAFHLETERLEYQPSIQFRSLKSLPVSWG